MGNTCKSMVIHVNVWQKPLEFCKVISLQLIKNKGKKIKVKVCSILKCVWNSQINLEKENKVGDLTLPNFTIYYNAIAIKTVSTGLRTNA